MYVLYLSVRMKYPIVHENWLEKDTSVNPDLGCFLLSKLPDSSAQSLVELLIPRHVVRLQSLTQDADKTCTERNQFKVCRLCGPARVVMQRI